MRKSLLAIGSIIVIMLGGAVYALVATQPSLAPVEATATPTPLASKITTADSSTATSAAPGVYVDYRSDIIGQTNGTKILFFHASWCPQCRQLEQSIKAGTIPRGVTIIKVDYDSNQALRQKYGVTIQTTLVRVNDAGSLEKRYVAYETPSLQALTTNLVP